MKLYRCVIGCLLVFFIVVGVWYVISCYDEQGSSNDGTLVWIEEQMEQVMRGEDKSVAGHSLY